ncbi:hypothetical protein RUND412_003832 [Rhizina undulata]
MKQGPRIAAAQDTEGATEDILRSFRSIPARLIETSRAFDEAPESVSKDSNSDKSSALKSIKVVNNEVSHAKDSIVRIIIEDSRTFYDVPESRSKGNDTAETTNQRPNIEDSNRRGSHAEESIDIHRWRASGGPERLRKIMAGEIEDTIEPDQVWNLEKPVFDPFGTLPKVKPTSSTQLYDSSLPPNLSTSAQKKWE